MTKNKYQDVIEAEHSMEDFLEDYAEEDVIYATDLYGNPVPVDLEALKNGGQS